MTPRQIQHTFDLAARYHQSGQLQEAEPLYKKILAACPGHVNALHNLGVLAFQSGRNDIAQTLFKRTIALAPELPEVHSNLGNALLAEGEIGQAITAYRRAITLKPAYVEAMINLGAALKDYRQLDDAIIVCRKAVSLSPENVQANYNLAAALQEKEAFNPAIEAYRRVIALKPDYAEAHNNLAVILNQMGRRVEAIDLFRRATFLNPGLAVAHFNLGNALKDKGEYDAAIAAYRKVVAIEPRYYEAYNNLGVILGYYGSMDEAISNLKQAIAIKPDLAEAHSNLAGVLKDQGQIHEAIETYRHAICLAPDNAKIGSSFLFALHHDPSVDARTLSHEHNLWNMRHAEPLREFIQQHSNDRTPDRRIRIGYISADLREHVVGQHLLPLFQAHDRSEIELTCYSQVARPDEKTAQLRQSSDRWRDISHLSDELTAVQIRNDQIDILVDLAVHSADNRLLVFARKPAPVLITYLGYCSTTGLTAMDYRISDPFLDPPDIDLSLYSEKTFYLRPSYWCYQPAQDVPDPCALPALGARFVTFGCLNNFSKISRQVLDLWAQILCAVPTARLLLHAKPGSHRQRTVDHLSACGVESNRIQFIGPQLYLDYMTTFNQIDISLDPFPYNGGITSFDSIWMGVPIVSLVRQTAVSRSGMSILTNLGLPELIGRTPQQFVKIAVDLAMDLPRLSELRATMRQRMKNSPLMDADRFARGMESAYRTMWRTWCMSV